jgi:UDP-glucose 4-epimerase|tara:strand:+ start:370 stop:1176 length:807 start_codon:yes stop_codon:yes gene_type:complete
MHENIVITGSSGFIAKALIKRLDKKKISFQAYSRKKNDNIISISNYGNIRPKKNSILVHLAQSHKPKKNFKSEINLINLLSKKKWKHIIFASSANIYGDDSIKPHKESEKVFPFNYYTKLKNDSEKIILKSKGTVMRFSNIYGHQTNKKTVIGLILDKIFNKKEIVMREIQSIRDFIWIDDVIDSIICSIKKKPGKILNIGSGKNYSIKDVILIALRASGAKIKKIKSKKKLKKISIISINIKHAKNELNWVPKVSLKKGLEKIFKKI